jgi:RNA polymerase-binding transcription factor DksA
MNGLTHTELIRLRRQLEKAEDDVRTLLQEEAARRRSGSGAETSYHERADAEAFANALNDEAGQLIDHCATTTKAIERCLAAMDSGKYGLCLDCGRHIGLKRLRAVPTAQRCIHCDAKAPRRLAS